MKKRTPEQYLRILGELALDSRAMRWLPDETYLKGKYRLKMGSPLDLADPKTFNEKLQWLKLHDRDARHTVMADKYAAKRYVAERIGEEYVIPLYGVWERFDDIDFDALPEQFVLKCTHDSGGLVICRDKSKLDRKKAKREIERTLKKNYYWHGREWPYKDIPPRIIAEKYMEDPDDGELRDYKFMCFNGEAKMMYISTGRGCADEEPKMDCFDMEFHHLPFVMGHPNAATTPHKPKHFDEMRALAEKLAEGCAHVRVDFYEVEGRIYFGEMTFFHFSGFQPFDSPEWDEVLGSYLKLPEGK